MSTFSPDPDKADGDIITGSIWNSLKNRISAFINSGNLGDINISSSPSERIDGSKIKLSGGTTASAHHATHEPGGADMVVDIKFNNGGLETAKLHAARHGISGADPLLPGTVDGASIAPGTVPEATLNPKRRRQSAFTSNALGLTPDPKYPLEYTLSNSTAALVGRMVVRNGKVYAASTGTSPHSVIEIDIASAVENVISLAVSDVVRTLVLIGSNIYVLCGSGTGNMKIKKIDNANVVTTVVDLNSGAAPNNLDTAVYMTCNGDGTILFTRASAGATVYCISVHADGTNLIKVSHGGLGATYGIVYAKRGTEEKVLFLQDATLRRINLDQTADTTLGTVANSRRIEYDGEHVVVGVSGGAVSHLVINPWGSGMVSVIEVANPSTIPGAAQVSDIGTDVGTTGDIFDGDAIHFAGRTGAGPAPALLSIYPLAGYRGTARLIVNTTPRSPGAIGMDATYLYLVYSQGGASTVIHRLLRN
jgi:hypothetical protein